MQIVMMHKIMMQMVMMQNFMMHKIMVQIMMQRKLKNALRDDGIWFRMV